MTSPLVTLKEQFKNGALSKPDFIRQMHAVHKHLFEYSGLLKETDISKIEIQDDAVVMTSRSTGIKVICDPNDERVAPIEILNFGAYEPADSAMLQRLQTPGSCVLDVGANFGWYSLILAKSIPSLQVHAFEPIPKTFAYLQKNVALNELANLRIWNFGFAQKAETATFYFYPEGSGNASLANLSERGTVEAVQCRIEVLDAFVAKEKLAPAFIKCDVEGAELLVFKGAVETLKAHQPIVFTEMLRKWAARFDYHPNEIITLFDSLGYHCFATEGAKLRAFSKMTDETVETNFFFLHKDRHAAQIKQLAAS